MSSVSKKESLVLGLALFAMFFGAGNLIFPPSLGAQAGEDWFVALLGFFVTGIGLPILGIMAFNKAGSLENFTAKVSPTFGIIYCSALILSLGPLLAIPRTGATTFEIGISPNFPSVSPLLSSAIYFLITLMIVLKPSQIIDNIGKILTPIILMMVLAIIVKGIVIKLGVPSGTSLNGNAFGIGFLEGYQTMDALGSMLLGSVIIKTLKSTGHNDPLVRQKLLFRAALISGGMLAIIYGGLLYLGSTVSVLSEGMSKPQLVMFIAESTLGNIGSLVLALAISAACLTTSSALVMSVAYYFSEVSRFSYKQIAIVTCIFSAIMAVQGVDMIIKIAVPILLVLYPITIILIVLNVLDIKNKMIYQVSVSVAMIISFIDLAAGTFNISFFKSIFEFMPLAHSGFVWLLPVIFITSFTALIQRKKIRI